WFSRSLEEEDSFDDGAELEIPMFKDPPSSPRPLLIAYAAAEIPQLPTVKDLLNSSQELEPSEEAQTYKGTDGLSYNIKSHKLFVPGALRERFLYWMHASPLGCHASVNRTYRRLKVHVWWPKMAKSVSEYVGGCLVCHRLAPMIKPPTVYNVLSRPLPLQLISLDVVGVRPWNDALDHYYLVIIDHASRFMVAESTTRSPPTSWIIQVLESKWIPTLMVPFAILTDRGSIFTSAEFVAYVGGKLGASLIHTSPFYPQGNAINESSHRTIDAMVSACMRQFGSSFNDALQRAVAAHNSTPHLSTGYTPFYMLHGFEPLLPGWQALYRTTASDSENRLADLQLMRTEAMLRASWRKETDLKEVEGKLRVGQWVVYLLADPAKEKGLSGGITKYSAKWSLPAKVKAVKDKIGILSKWGSAAEVQIPLIKIKILQGEVPFTLVEANMKELQIVAPVLRSHHQQQQSTPRVWTDFLDQVDPCLEPAEFRWREKRLRQSIVQEFK
ncbi:MAG: hypothetical protein ACRDE7_05180, partial [Sphingobacterium sp.]